MEPKERLVIEIILGVIFGVFLILVSMIVMNASGGSETETTTTNSFNTYNYNLPAQIAQTRYTTPTTKPYIVDDGRRVRVYPSRVIYDTNYVYNYDSNYDRKRYFSYDSLSQLRISEGLFGNSINNYEVYVQNREYVGGYFKTVFYFEDYYGGVDSESMTHYIGPREGNRFVLKDVSPSKYDYRRWWYEVKPLTKAPTTKTYYDDNTPRMRMYSSDSQTRDYFYIN